MASVDSVERVANHRARF